MLTRSLATAAVLACVGALAACGSENDTAADASPASESPQSPESESGDSGEFTPAADGECAYVEDGNPVQGRRPPAGRPHGRG